MDRTVAESPGRPVPTADRAPAEPIVAVATAPGQGGIGVVRVSGRNLDAVIVGLCGSVPAPRRATYAAFKAADGTAIDRGIALFFPAPNSYTGEDVVELQGHGGPVVLRMLVERCLELGAGIGLRHAEPGEFTRRAFLNDKLDLAQAEAVADLISARTAAAAKSAQASLSGAFSSAVRELVDATIRLRTLVEATLDFPEEEIDFLQQSDARGRLSRLRERLERLLAQSRQGALLRGGIKVVLAGRPNVGKSSLLNALAQAEVAIVTPIAGTTRDRIVETIQIDGVPLHIVDTAGIRELGNKRDAWPAGDADAPAASTAISAAHSDADRDQIERIGIARSWAEIEGADVILHLRDAAEPDTAEDRSIAERLDTLAPSAGQSGARLAAESTAAAAPLRIVYNKIDLTAERPRADGIRLYVSAKTGAGVDLLRRELLAIAGWHADGETVYLARDRHLRALRAADRHLQRAADYALESDRQLDLFAEELRLAQHELNSITGEFSADDLLGEIFSRFCIGK